MKRTWLIAVLAACLAVTAPALAQTFTAAEIEAAAGLRFEVPATQRAMQSHVPEVMTWINAADVTFSGVLGGVHSPVATIAALKAIAATGATARVDKQICMVETGPTSGQALYVFDSASVAAGNDNTVVAPTAGTGRWIKLSDPSDTAMLSVLISTSNGFGASLIGIEDAAPGYYTATTVEGALREVKLLADAAMPTATLALTTTGNGAALVGVEDAAPGYFTATTVEAALREKAIALATLTSQKASYLAPVLAEWDPTGPVDPPTAVTGDRYMANATAGAYTVWRVYEYNGATWDEHSPVNGDVAYNKDTDLLLSFNGATWDKVRVAAFTGDSGAGGAIGLVPAPAAGDAAAGKYLKADGGWTTPPDTTYADFTGDSGAGGVHGLVPAPAAGDAAAGKFLKAGGAWAVAMEPVVPSVPHSIATLAGTTGALESSEVAIAEFPRIVRTRISTPADGNAHDTAYTLPSGAIVLDAWVTIVTPDTAPGSTTLSVGVNGATTGFFNGIDLTGSGTVTCDPTLDGGGAYFVSTVCGAGLSKLIAGSGTDDRGLWYRFPALGQGGKALAYQASAASNAVVDVYIMIALP